MNEHEGRFLRQTGSAGYAARVTVRVDHDSREPGIHFACSGEGWKRQGAFEEATPNGYDDWKAGARVGAEYALRRAGILGCRVTITKIIGMVTDTNSTIVAAAATFGVWQALGYQPDADERERIERVTLDSWSPGAPKLPSFDA